jgi:hypothetical protein
MASSLSICIFCKLPLLRKPQEVAAPLALNKIILLQKQQVD